MGSPDNGRNIKIGSAGFKAAEIVRRWKELRDSNKLGNEWPDLARLIKISEHSIRTNRNKIMLGATDAFEVTIQILNEWKDTSDVEPTVGMLIDILEGLNWHSYARILKEDAGIKN